MSVLLKNNRAEAPQGDFTFGGSVSLLAGTSSGVPHITVPNATTGAVGATTGGTIAFRFTDGNGNWGWLRGFTSR